MQVWNLNNDFQITSLILCALFFILHSYLSTLTKSFPTSNIFLAIPWAKQVFFFVSFFFIVLCSSSVSWLCLLAETISFPHTVQQVSPYWRFFFFLSFHNNVLPCKEKVKVNSGRLILLFLQHIWVELDTDVWENTWYMRSSSLQPASVLLKVFHYVNWIVNRPQHLMREQPQWSMVCVVPSSLRSALLQLKQNYTFCPEELSFDSVTCPQRYRGTFAIVIL